MTALIAIPKAARIQQHLDGLKSAGVSYLFVDNHIMFLGDASSHLDYQRFNGEDLRAACKSQCCERIECNQRSHDCVRKICTALTYAPWVQLRFQMAQLRLGSNVTITAKDVMQYAFACTEDCTNRPPLVMNIQQSVFHEMHCELKVRLQKLKLEEHNLARSEHEMKLLAWKDDLKTLNEEIAAYNAVHE